MKEIELSKKGKRYKDIYAHEQAHKTIAGSYGGPIVIERPVLEPLPEAPFIDFT